VSGTTVPGVPARPRAAARPPEGVVHAEGLTKAFGGTTVLEDVDLDVPAGSLHALLGPNGAGKTTTVRILTTLLRADRGRAVVAGHDVAAEPDAVRRVIGLSGQYAAVDAQLSGRENLHMLARLHGFSSPAATARAGELLERFRLLEFGERRSGAYSGGMRRRLDLACALVAHPSVVVLDEPTTGLDPRSRTETWEVVRELLDDGAGVLLTTQYLEEADQLADEVTVVDRGRVAARGTPGELKARVRAERVVVTVPPGDPTALDAVAPVLARVAGEDPVLDRAARTAEVPVTAGAEALKAVLRRTDAAGLEIADLAVRRSTLDDVFLSLTGDAAGKESP
jgi:ABC-2 type transport system ATP-binding protein